MKEYKEKMIKTRIVAKILCDSCKKEMSNDYFNFSTGHNDWGNDSADSVESFANAMRRALSDDEFALKIGLAGRETAVAHFSHLAQGKLISKFLSENIKNREN